MIAAATITFITTILRLDSEKFTYYLWQKMALLIRLLNTAKPDCLLVLCF